MQRNHSHLRLAKTRHTNECTRSRRHDTHRPSQDCRTLFCLRFSSKFGDLGILPHTERKMSNSTNECTHSLVQPIAERAAQHLHIISKNFQSSTTGRRTRILMGFIIYYLVLIVNPIGRILVRWKRFRNTLGMLSRCHPTCNWL